MSYTSDQLENVFDRSSGHCHLCHKKLAFRNYALFGRRGAWEVEHSNPRANGGTDRPSNLYPACIPCNRSKGAASTRSARAVNGKTRAPLSVPKRQASKLENAVLGGFGGWLLGSLLNPAVGIIGGLLGAEAGHRHNPDR